MTGSGADRARIRIGLSGWRYPHWRRGAFYPVGLVQRRELEFVAESFDTPTQFKGTLCYAWMGM